MRISLDWDPNKSWRSTMPLIPKSLLIRVFAAALVSSSVLVAGKTLEANMSAFWVQKLGWYWTASLVVAFGFAVFSAVRSSAEILGACRRHWLSSTLVVLPLLVLIGHLEPKFRVIYDEPVLSATALTMHMEREAAAVSRAYVIDGKLAILSTVLDKRPFLFPFLLSLVHDLTGYRLENVFFLNQLIASALVILLFHHLRIEFGYGPAILGCLLLYSFPLIAQSAAGGGFDLLHLLLLQVVLVFGGLYLRSGDGPYLNCFIYSFVLLASNRYEAILFAVPVVILVVAGWFRRRRVELTWAAVAAPVFLLPVILLNRFAMSTEGVFKRPGGEPQTPFSLGYFEENFGHAVQFLIDFGSVIPNSPLLSAAGIICSGFWIALLWRGARRRSLLAFDISCVVISGGILASTGLLLLYFWGNWTEFVVSRLTMPLHLLFIWAFARVVFEVGRGFRYQAWATGVMIFYILAYTTPNLVKDQGLNAYHPATDIELIFQFMRDRPEENHLFITRSQVPPALMLRSGLSISDANAKIDNLRFHHGTTFKEIYIFQFVHTSPRSNIERVDAADQVSDDILVEPVEQVRLSPFLTWRVSKVVGFAPSDVAVDDLFPLLPDESAVSRWARTLP
jgi:hypothetical protein